jgi:hypothetical protein
MEDWPIQSRARQNGANSSERERRRDRYQIRQPGRQPMGERKQQCRHAQWKQHGSRQKRG